MSDVSKLGFIWAEVPLKLRPAWTTRVLLGLHLISHIQPCLRPRFIDCQHTTTERGHYDVYFDPPRGFAHTLPSNPGPAPALCRSPPNGSSATGSSASLCLAHLVGSVFSDTIYKATSSTPLPRDWTCLCYHKTNKNLRDGRAQRATPTLV